MRKATLDLTMPVMSRASARTRSPRLVKITASLLETDLVGIEDPAVALDLDGVAARPGHPGESRGPRDLVAEAGVERPEVFGRVHDVGAGEVVLDALLLHHRIEDVTSVVVVDGDEAGH